LFEGYYNRPDLTAKAIVDGWYHTGDLGSYLNDELYVIGRKKDLLIVGGENIYLQDIKDIVTSHPLIHDGRAVARGVYNPDLGTTEKTVVVSGRGKRAASPERDRHRTGTPRPGCSRQRRGCSDDFSEAAEMDRESTAGKPTRSSNRRKLLRERPELNVEGKERLTFDRGRTTDD